MLLIAGFAHADRPSRIPNPDHRGDTIEIPSIVDTTAFLTQKSGSGPPLPS
jgi:hypothetical protein